MDGYMDGSMGWMDRCKDKWIDYGSMYVMKKV